MPQLSLKNEAVQIRLPCKRELELKRGPTCLSDCRRLLSSSTCRQWLKLASAASSMGRTRGKALQKERNSGRPTMLRGKGKGQGSGGAC